MPTDAGARAIFVDPNLLKVFGASVTKPGDSSTQIDEKWRR
jgi:hypothetical protein